MLKHLAMASSDAGAIAAALLNQTTPLFVVAVGDLSTGVGEPRVAQDIRAWGLHPGHKDDALGDYLAKGIAAIGWPELGDPRSLGNDQDAFKRARAAAIPTMPPNGVPVSAAMIRKFVYDMDVGHLIVCPAEDSIHIGRIAGSCEYDAGARYPTFRATEWLARVDRSQLSPALEQAIRNNQTLFDLSSYHTEIEALIKLAGQASRLWWVNQGVAYRQQRDDEYVWAPRETQSGSARADWQNVMRLANGETLIHYSEGQVRAVGTVRGEPREAPKPADLGDQWGDQGFRGAVSYKELANPIDLSTIPDEWRLAENARGSQGDPSAFDRTGGVKQGYLYRVSDELAKLLRERFPELDGVASNRFDVPWKNLVAHLRDARSWQLLDEGVEVTDVLVFPDRITFRLPGIEAGQAIHRDQLGADFESLRRNGELPKPKPGGDDLGRVRSRGQLDLLALLPNVEYSLRPLRLHWVDPASHKVGEVKERRMIEVIVPRLTMDWLMEKTLWRREELDELCDTIRSGAGQVVLAGPPGTRL